MSHPAVCKKVTMLLLSTNAAVKNKEFNSIV
jgi:hypothetical protein